MSEETKDQGLVFEDGKTPEESSAESKETKQEIKKQSPSKKNEEKKPAAEKKPKAKPKLFFSKNEKIEILVNGYHNAQTGEYSFGILGDATEEPEEQNETDSAEFVKVPYRFYFTPCPYDRLSRYRSYSMIYNQEDQNNTINLVRLREFFLVNHLVDWNITDDDGNKIELQFDPNRTLSRKSLDIVYMLPPNLLDIVLVSYERRIGAGV